MLTALVDGPGHKTPMRIAHRQSAVALAVTSTHPDSGVRQATARNPSTPAPVLAALAEDRSNGTRQAAAPNPTTPAAARAELFASSAAGRYPAGLRDRQPPRAHTTSVIMRPGT